MGQLVYGQLNERISFDDRALFHLQHVIVAKLRRRESFAFTWAVAPAMGDRRNTLWLHPTTTLVFVYAGSRIPTVNREWIVALALSANSAGGLYFSPEPTGARAS